MQNKVCLNATEQRQESANCRMDDITERNSGFQDAFLTFCAP